MATPKEFNDFHATEEKNGKRYLTATGKRKSLVCGSLRKIRELSKFFL